jgi:hypothetical protein
LISVAVAMITMATGIVLGVGVAHADGVFQIMNAYNSECLVGGLNVWRTGVSFAPCNSADQNQLWHYVAVNQSAGYVGIQDSTGGCLQASYSSEPGLVQAFGCDPNFLDQQWIPWNPIPNAITFEAAGGPTYHDLGAVQGDVTSVYDIDVDGYNNQRQVEWFELGVSA